MRPRQLAAPPSSRNPPTLSSCAVRAAAEAHSPTHHPSILSLSPPQAAFGAADHSATPNVTISSQQQQQAPLPLPPLIEDSRQSIIQRPGAPPPSAAGLVSMTAPIPGPAPGSPDMLQRFEEGDRAEPRLREHHHPGSKPPKEPRPSGVPSPCRPRGRAPPTGRVIILHSPDSHIRTRRCSNCASG